MLQIVALLRCSDGEGRFRDAAQQRNGGNNMRQTMLSLAPAATPSRPTWFDTVGGQENRQTFDDLAELARHVVRISEGRGLRLSAQQVIACATGLEPFPAWSIYALGEDGAEDWLGHAAVQGAARERLEAAILAARKNGPRRAA